MGKVSERKRLAFLHSFERTTRGDAAHEGKLLHLALEHLILHRFGQLKNFDGAALIVAAANEALFLQRGDVLVHGGERGELHTLADLFKAGRVAVLVLEGNEIIQDFFLTFGQGHGCNLRSGERDCAAPHSHNQVRRKESERQAKLAPFCVLCIATLFRCGMIYKRRGRPEKICSIGHSRGSSCDWRQRAHSTRSNPRRFGVPLDTYTASGTATTRYSSQRN